MTPANRRPLLLVSVRSAEEALAALAGGADWIDLKEPARGPLGAVDPNTARDAVHVVAGRAPVSAAAGELRDWPDGGTRRLLGAPGVEILKLGLAGMRSRPWRDAWRAAAREAAAHGKRLAAVAYADHQPADAPCPADVVALAGAERAPWALVDTFDKGGPALGALWSPAELAAWLRAAHDAGCRTAVAGRLDAAAIGRLPRELVDVIAVRGAACSGERLGAVSVECVAALSAIVARRGEQPAFSRTACVQSASAGDAADARFS